MDFKSANFPQVYAALKRRRSETGRIKLKMDSSSPR